MNIKITVVLLVFSISLVLPAVLSVLWSHTRSQPSLVGNTGLSADQQSLAPSDTLLYQ